METLGELSELYTELEKVRKPSREASDFMSEYLRRKGEIADRLRVEFTELLKATDDDLIDNLPKDTKIEDSETTTLIEGLRTWHKTENE